MHKSLAVYFVRGNGSDVAWSDDGVVPGGGALRFAISREHARRTITELEGRRSTSWAALPNVLDHTALAQELKGFPAPLASDGKSGSDIIGAVFAINGEISGAEIYGGNGLFRRMWPLVLRAYATEAVAANGRPVVPPPSPRTVREFLALQNAQPLCVKAPVTMRANEATTFAEVRGPDGAWVHRSYLSRLGLREPGVSPEAAILAALHIGSVNGRLIDTLDANETLLPRRDGPGRWSAAVVDLKVNPILYTLRTRHPLTASILTAVNAANHPTGALRQDHERVPALATAHARADDGAAPHQPGGNIQADFNRASGTLFAGDAVLLMPIIAALLLTGLLLLLKQSRLSRARRQYRPCVMI